MVFWGIRMTGHARRSLGARSLSVPTRNCLSAKKKSVREQMLQTDTQGDYTRLKSAKVIANGQATVGKGPKSN